VELYVHSPNTPSWRGAQLKEAEGQLYLYQIKERCVNANEGMRNSLHTESLKVRDYLRDIGVGES